ncbi:MAG TPA: hypothetical protein VG889_10245 [Rhizomicrobium sp.]|nr:hypothetical protein [Rhizomicrobium sp.]
MGHSIDSLPMEDRAQHYRDCAVQAFRLAETTRSPDLKATYLQVATGWHTMALEIELALGSEEILDALMEGRSSHPA